MKKLFLGFFVFVFAICGAYAGNSEQIAKLVETIKNAPAGSITATNVPTTDDCMHVKVNKDGNTFLYERACFPIDLRFKGFDPVKHADYTFTIYDGAEESEISGIYEDFKELIAVIPASTEPKLEKQSKSYVHECDAEHKIKIVWDGTNDYHVDSVSVYQMQCNGDDCKNIDKEPMIYKFDKSGCSPGIEYVPGRIYAPCMIGYIFKNKDSWVWLYASSDAALWKIDNKLCEFGVPKKEYSLQDKINDWKKMDGFNLVCAGGYPGEIDGFSDVNIYKVAQPEGSRGGYPIAYAVHDDKIIREFNGFESMEVLRKVAFRPCGRKFETNAHNEPIYVEKDLGCGDDKVDVSLYQDYAMVRVGAKNIKLDKKEIKDDDEVKYSNDDIGLIVNVLRSRRSVDEQSGMIRAYKIIGFTELRFLLNEKLCMRSDNKFLNEETQQKLEPIFK